MSATQPSPVTPPPGHRLCVAPMMDYTDRHCRFFMRQLSRHTWLYTEMVTTGAVLHGDRERLLGFDPAEQPLALQLGGCEPEALARAARIGADMGYSEINLNVGCPSDRVQAARFGACLMAEPALVADCVRAMAAGSSLPVSVKTRLGIDDHDSYEALCQFVQAVREAGCRTLILHARKAWLQGLSPKQNREIPPLRYEVVYAVKRDFPDLEVVLNGGVGSLDEAEAHLAHVDGVMIGRAACHDPYLLAGVDGRLFGDAREPPTREEVVQRMRPYIARHLEASGTLSQCTRHLIGLFHGCPGARGWRRTLSDEAHRRPHDLTLLDSALEKVASAGPPARVTPGRQACR